MKRYSNRKIHIRNKRKYSYNIEQNNQLNKNDNYNEKNEFFVFEPMNKVSSEKNRNAQNVHNESDESKTKYKKSENIANNGKITNYEKDESKKQNIIDTINNFLDKILSDEILIMALIAIIFYERNKMKNTGADKNILNDYDMMIAALIYLLI